MNDTQLNFKACIENLEKLNKEYIQLNRGMLETSSPTQIPVTPTVLVNGSVQATSTTNVIIINDYVRLCRVYCIMLWTYWEALGLLSTAVEELRLVRNCLVHHEGDMARYSQAVKPKWATDGTRLMTISTGKSYVQGYSLVITDLDLIYFTNLIKNEFASNTGINLITP